MNKIQTGLRIPEALYDELKEIANRSGTSVNAVALLLIDMGLQVVNLGVQESLRVEPHSQQHNGGECVQPNY